MLFFFISTCVELFSRCLEFLSERNSFLMRSTRTYFYHNQYRCIASLTNKNQHQTRKSYHQFLLRINFIACRDNYYTRYRNISTSHDQYYYSGHISPTSFGITFSRHRVHSIQTGCSVAPTVEEKYFVSVRAWIYTHLYIKETITETSIKDGNQRVLIVL